MVVEGVVGVEVCGVRGLVGVLSPSVRPYLPSLCKCGGPSSLAQSIGQGGVELSRPLRPKFSRGSPLWGNSCPGLGKKSLRSPPYGG